MINGGTCWKCPEDKEDKGPWIRSATPVNSDSACWRVPKEKLGPAIKVKSPAWSWDCPSGSFWDGYAPDGPGGSCWKCPDHLPRRTGYAVYSGSACATPASEETRAILLSYNGCPKPDAETMNLPGLRTPGKAFLDIAAGSACFACPITDQDGNFLISDRNANPLYGNSNTGCSIKLNWKPATFPFHDPGLAYMQGVKELIWEKKLFDDGPISGFLYDQAETKGLGDATPRAKEWVEARWLEIASSPYNSEQFRAYVFILLKNALAKEAGNRTAAEKKLIESFSTYIQRRRTYLAEQALAMYDVWKASDDQFRANTGQGRQFSALFHYGTVPLDFQGTLSELMGKLGGGGASVLLSLVSVHQFTKGITVVDEIDDFGGASRVVNFRTQFYGITSSLKYLKTLQGFKAMSGPSLIQAAFAILSSVAIDQFIAIQSARPNLEASLALAQQPVNLAALQEDTLYLFWSKAMDTGDPEDAQVLQLAQTAQIRAEQSGYQAPPKVHSILPTTDKLSSSTSSGFLNQGQKLVSNNRRYEAEMQTDGNFVIYAANRQPIWATNTNGKGSGPYKLELKPDGSLLVYGSNTQIWTSSRRSSLGPPFTLIMQDDGNLVVYDRNHKPLWASNTNR